MPSRRTVALSLVEVIIGLGLAGALVLLMLLLGTTAMRADAKASDRQIAAAVAETQLDLLTRQLMVVGPQRAAFWAATGGPYSEPSLAQTVVSSGTEYQLAYSLEPIPSPPGAPNGGLGNRLCQVQLRVSWWGGEKGKPGYGQFSIERTRLLRESHVLP